MQLDSLGPRLITYPGSCFIPLSIQSGGNSLYPWSVLYYEFVLVMNCYACCRLKTVWCWYIISFECVVLVVVVVSVIVHSFG